jgi:hypothetical protein
METRSDRPVTPPNITLEYISSMRVYDYYDKYPCDCCTDIDAMRYYREYDVTLWHCKNNETPFRMGDNPMRERALLEEEISSMRVCEFDDDYPCDCCTEYYAMHDIRDYDVTLWHCIRNQITFRIGNNPNRERSPTPCVNESRGDILSYCRKNNVSPTWATILDEEDYQEELTMTDERRAAKAAAEAERRRIEDDNELAARMFNYAEHQRHLNSRGKGKDRHIDKIDEPCKFIYCDESAPKNLWRMNERRKLCAPERLYLTGSRCWGHNVLNPTTGRLETPCKRLHPDEDGWRDEWDTNRYFRPQVLINSPPFANRANNATRRNPRRLENGAW